ncbi:hypothetical protein MNBD_GAMMA02-1709 [hydrothermal vent metagenome]|uniref:DUF2007 domain-containing protein n=1 Tax=hydrothermal vent metagenome TaxID=652676 RepID=A0A3B0VRU7_9ZZZZ
MKLLTEFDNEESADIVYEEFWKKGILTYVSSADSKKLGTYQTGALKVGLWVILDEQYEDSLAVLNDPSHTVKIQLSSEEMKLLEERVINANEKYYDSFVNKTLLIAVILITIIFIVFVSHQPR